MRNQINKRSTKEIVSKSASKYFPSKLTKKSNTGNILTNMTQTNIKTGKSRKILLMDITKPFFPKAFNRITMTSP